MNTNSIFEYMAKYGHENLIICQDSAINFKAIIAIHSTALGPAAGGIRMWNYKSELDAIEDALRLSRGMTYKYAAAGVNFGGAKTVLMMDPKRKDREVIFRTLGKFINRLGGKVRTGQDVGTTLEDMEYLFMETDYVNTLPQYLGGIGPISPSTASGVIYGMRAAAKEVFGTDDLKGMAVSVQGLGSVGSSIVQQLHEMGVNLVVTDIDPDRTKSLAAEFGLKKVEPDEIYDVDCDIFCPCALGAILNEKNIPRLKCKLICGSANNQLKDEKQADLLIKKGILYAPDYIVNAGGAIYDADRVMAGDVSIERANKKVAQIYQTTEQVIKIAKKENIPTYRAADIFAERRIKAISGVKRYWETMEIR